MKNWIIILICLILGFVIYILFGKYNSYIIGSQHFKYQDCNIKYKQEYINWNQSSMFDPNNRWLEDCAKATFIKCLCEKYIVTRDTIIKDYVESAYREDNWYQNNFIGKVRGLDTTILMNNKENIFRNDPIGEKAIIKFRNDTIALIKILSTRFYENYRIRLEYYNMILSLPAENVTIDTLVKYKEIIF